MSLRIHAAGLEATLQGAPRTGLRHRGVPFAGPADPVSLALANRTVGNLPDAVGIEITLGGFEAEAEAELVVALAGAPAPAHVSGQVRAPYQPIRLSPGDMLTLAPPARGMRTYLAVAGGFVADRILGSPSTYLPAALGGLAGRALARGDRIALANGPVATPVIPPETVRPPFPGSWALRAIRGPDTGGPPSAGHDGLFAQAFTVSSQSNRMGIRLTAAPRLPVTGDGRMASAPVFPGTLQVPEDGHPILLGVDAQTTGGYARMAQVAACDRHLIGQLRPGDRVRFLHRTAEAAEADGRAKRTLLAPWLTSG